MAQRQRQRDWRIEMKTNGDFFEPMKNNEVIKKT
jgi:hypothetical protein